MLLFRTKEHWIWLANGAGNSGKKGISDILYIEFHAGHFNHSLNILEAVPSWDQIKTLGLFPYINLQGKQYESVLYVTYDFFKYTKTQITHVYRILSAKAPREALQGD